MGMDHRTFEQLKELGPGRIASDNVASLYHLAFQEFGHQALWSRQPSAHPTIAQALIVSDCLRREVNQITRSLAAQIKEACRAAL
ncbi:MAG: hypothetical protein G8237_08895 [Magnetococcales bacterium]|nr:hypothetical protein [Magnetococcales bacterium]